MPKTIYKYPLKITGTQNIDMPMGAEVLTLQVQNGIPCIWALVDPMQPLEIKTFETFGTGHPVPVEVYISRQYISTYQLNGSVSHVFERLGLL